jgi:hypothetical protein
MSTSRKAAASAAIQTETPERSVLDMITQIRSGDLDPKTLAPADRQACVAHLCAEGLCVPEIAQFLKHSDRTITRDRRAIQEAAALTHDPQLAGRIAGQLVQEAMVCMDRIRRVSRDRETPPAVKVEAERFCFQILSELTQLLQSLGYLPTAAQRVEADLTHHAAEVPTLEAIGAKVKSLTELAEFHVGDVPGVKQLIEEFNRAALAIKVDETAAKVGKGTQP